MKKKGQKGRHVAHKCAPSIARVEVECQIKWQIDQRERVRGEREREGGRTRSARRINTFACAKAADENKDNDAGVTTYTSQQGLPGLPGLSGWWLRVCQQ